MSDARTSADHGCGHAPLFAQDSVRWSERVTPCPYCKIETLRAALTHSVSVIQTWHNMELPLKERSNLWDIYWRHAPEMKHIREALRGNVS